jgi:hypothetical protein
MLGLKTLVYLSIAELVGMMVTTVTELNVSYNKLQAIPLEYASKP